MHRIVKTEWRKLRFAVISSIILLTIIVSVLSCTLYKDYALHYDLEAWEIGTEVISLIFPLLVVIPICWNLYYERKDHFLLYVSPRVSIKQYLFLKWCVYAISAFMIIFVPYFIASIFSLYIKAPISSINGDGSSNFSHVFLNTFVKSPLLYAVLMSFWKGIIGVITMTMGFVLSLYVNNIFVILTGSFVYSVLENFLLSVIGFEKYRLVTAFDPTTLSAKAVNIMSFIIGPMILCAVIFLIFIICSKVKKIDVVEV